MMDVIYTHCCGLDVHKKTVVACLITSAEGLEPVKEIRTFRTMTADLLALADWLQEAGCTHVGLDHGVGHFRPLSITRQRHLLAYHGIAMSCEGLCQGF